MSKRTLLAIAAIALATAPAASAAWTPGAPYSATTVLVSTSIERANRPAAHALCKPDLRFGHWFTPGLYSEGRYRVFDCIVWLTEGNCNVRVKVTKGEAEGSARLAYVKRTCEL